MSKVPMKRIFIAGLKKGQKKDIGDASKDRRC